ncbi:unnamed protein product [Effrenium voratum]|nr:unnamed protein product [Effrenium voratum]
MVADGGAQHTVELAWDGSYGKPQPAEAAVSVEVEGRSQEAPSDEPPLKRRAVEVSLWDAEGAAQAAAEVLRYFSGHLLSEPAAARGFETFGSAQGEGVREMQVLWSPRDAKTEAPTSQPAPKLSKEVEQHLAAQISCLRRSSLESLLLATARRDQGVCEAIAARHCDSADATL